MTAIVFNVMNLKKLGKSYMYSKQKNWTTWSYQCPFNLYENNPVL